MRIVRRALRQWQREFLAFWGRFTAFHRIVIGIVLAMFVVFAVRTRVLDPMDRELAALQKELASKGVPVRVPAPEMDEVIQEETLRAENLGESLQRLGAELAQVEASSPFRLQAGKADGHSALRGLAGRRGLHVRKNAPAEAPTDGPVPAAASEYELVGRFAAIHGFLDDMRREPLLWEMRDVSIDLLNGSAPSGGAAPLLVLRFKLVQHLYRGGRA